ncbi:hypothetical protein Cgig2_030497 [Carnegiea gigantea]|uniref:Uncharacterized protein n=1 Tax=Carnegiea gigantea TaxID=171969 RepID=A0A9Q1GSI8_9CARY|nr:hypothetical protein Cgig2_030497 [Carnegiea gigantea]
MDVLRLLSSILEYVCLYVEYSDDTKLDVDDNDSMVVDDYNEYRSDFDDEKVVKMINKKQKMEKDHLADLEALRDEAVEITSGDYVNNPPSSETDEDGDEEGRKSKKKRTIIYPRCKEKETKDGPCLQALHSSFTFWCQTPTPRSTSYARNPAYADAMNSAATVVAIFGVKYTGFTLKVVVFSVKPPSPRFNFTFGVS